MLVVDITPTAIQFLKNEKLYNITEVIEDGKDLLIKAREVDSEINKFEEEKLIEET